MDSKVNRLKMWNEVSTTDPAYCKKGDGKGYSYTAISPYYQIKKATEQFGPYGIAWGMYYNEYIFIDGSNMVMFKCLFKYPGGEFPIANVIKYKGIGKNDKEDEDFAKKVETDTLTKSLSRLGFNADVFMGKFEDSRYMADLHDEIRKGNIILSNEDFISDLKDSLNKGPTDPEWMQMSLAVKQLDEELFGIISLSPKNGGPLTTDERKAFRSIEFINAYFESMDDDTLNQIIADSTICVERKDGPGLYEIWSELDGMERNIVKFHMEKEVSSDVGALLTDNAKAMKPQK